MVRVIKVDSLEKFAELRCFCCFTRERRTEGYEGKVTLLWPGLKPVALGQR